MNDSSEPRTAFNAITFLASAYHLVVTIAGVLLLKDSWDTPNDNRLIGGCILIGASLIGAMVWNVPARPRSK